MALITSQIKKTVYMFLAFGALSAVLCVVTSFVISPFATTGVVMFMGICFFFFVFARRKKWKMTNEEVKSICEEFKPKFQMKGYSLDYFDTVGMFVVCRVENSV